MLDERGPCSLERAGATVRRCANVDDAPHIAMCESAISVFSRRRLSPRQQRHRAPTRHQRTRAAVGAVCDAHIDGARSAVERRLLARRGGRVHCGQVLPRGPSQHLSEVHLRGAGSRKLELCVVLARRNLHDRLGRLSAKLGRDLTSVDRRSDPSAQAGQRSDRLCVGTRQARTRPRPSLGLCEHVCHERRGAGERERGMRCGSVQRGANATAAAEAGVEAADRKRVQKPQLGESGLGQRGVLKHKAAAGAALPEVQL
eukprot:5084054-Prymnesium_polylepis.2